MGKNANGEGSIYKRMRDGRVVGYVAAFTYTDEDGRAQRVRVYGPTRADARDKLMKARERIENGAPARDATMPVGAWLARWRATTLAASDRKQATKALYENLARLHLEPEPFGAARLNKLKPSDIEKLILAMRAKTKPGPKGADGKPGEPVRALSDSTIRSTYTVLRAALYGAVRDGLLAKNPAAAVKRPGVERTEAKHLDQGAVAQVLAAAEESRYHPALVLIAATGMRRGEVLALAWDRVDLDAGTLKVAATIGRIGGQLVISAPKTERSRRIIPLSPAVVALLRKHRATQAAEKLRAGNQWQEAAWCSRRNWEGRSTHATSYASSRRLPGRPVSKRICIRSGIVRPSRCLSKGCISRRSPICSDIRPWRSPAISTGTRATTQHAPQ